jgi:hypothetical protein
MNKHGTHPAIPQRRNATPLYKVERGRVAELVNNFIHCIKTVAAAVLKTNIFVQHQSVVCCKSKNYQSGIFFNVTQGCLSYQLNNLVYAQQLF